MDKKEKTPEDNLMEAIFDKKYKTEAEIESEIQKVVKNTTSENKNLNNDSMMLFIHAMNRREELVDGANWQRERDAKYKADNNICCMNFDDIEAARIGAYEQGKSDMKQQMMNTAIDGYIDQIEYPGSTFIQLSENPKDFNNGEDVKVIIIKNKEG